MQTISDCANLPAPHGQTDSKGQRARLRSSSSSSFTCPRPCCHFHLRTTGLLAWTGVEGGGGGGGGCDLRMPTPMLLSNALWHWSATTPAPKCVFRFLLSCLFAWHHAMFSCLFAWQKGRLFFPASVQMRFPAYSAALPGTVPSVLFCFLA